MPQVKIPKIQIAGLKTTKEIDLCARAGADGYGLLLMLDYPRGDALDPEVAADLSAYTKNNLPNGCSVLISHARDPKTIIDTAAQVGTDAFQVHNDSGEEIPLDALKEIKSGLKDTSFIKALHIPSHGPLSDNLRKQAKNLAEIADALIFDTKAIEQIEGKEYQTLGGTGKANNWDIAKELVKLVSPIPVIYAGGLTLENVADAIAHIRPYGVDVNSGVRKDGSFDKDYNKVQAFVKNARAAFDNLLDKPF